MFSLIGRAAEQIQKIPEPLKLPTDLAAIAGWVSVLAGFLTDTFAVVAAIASAVWAVLRAMNEYDVRKKNKG